MYLSLVSIFFLFYLSIHTSVTHYRYLYVFTFFIIYHNNIIYSSYGLPTPNPPKRLTPADEPRIRVPSSSSSLSSKVPTVSTTDTTGQSTITSDNFLSTAVYHGIGVGSRVMRGPSWKYDNQDGGEGKLGTVIELRRWKASYNLTYYGNNGIAGIRVLWDYDGTINTYRWSAKSIEEGGIQDLKVVGWKELTPVMQNIPSKQEELLQNFKNQLTTTQNIELLIDMYNNLNGPQWYAKRGWNNNINSLVNARNQENIKESNNLQYIKNSNNPCTDGWEGITCQDGVILSIDLSNNNLQGKIPLSLYKLLEKGIISLNLARNPGIQWESFDSNKYSKSNYSPLSELCNYGKYLQFIDLSNTNLYGKLPECFSKLNKLETLVLHTNNLEGSIPNEWSKLLKSSSSSSSFPSAVESTLPYLKALQLHGNPLLTTPIPTAFIEKETTLQSFTLPSHLMYELRFLRQQYNQ